MNRAAASAGAWSLFMVGIQVVLIGMRSSGIVHWSWWLVLIPAEIVVVGMAFIGATIISMVARDNRARRRA